VVEHRDALQSRRPRHRQGHQARQLRRVCAVAQKNLADAEGYFDEHLAQNDYYAAVATKIAAHRVPATLVRMPFLCDETNAYTFRQANQRWPTNYEELAIFMKQSTNYDGFDRFDFITKPDGNLEIIAYTFSSGMTNRITVKAPDKP